MTGIQPMALVRNGGPSIRTVKYPINGQLSHALFDKVTKPKNSPDLQPNTRGGILCKCHFEKSQNCAKTKGTSHIYF